MPDLQDQRAKLPLSCCSRQSLCVLATLPPPVTGMTLATLHVVRSLQDSGDTLVHDWSVGSNPRRRFWRIIKAIRSIGSVFYLVFWRWNSSGILYTVANAGYGLYYNMFVISCARLLGYRCILHHQVFSYLHQFDWRMNLIVRMMGRKGIQIVLAPEMKHRFHKLYGEMNEFFILPNTIIMRQEDEQLKSGREWSSDKPMVLGHLSNLTIEKGLGHVIASFERMRSMDLDVRLVLAGPVSGTRERSIIDNALRIHGSRIEYRGPVYGTEKARFFDDIDVFLFPTQYRNEAQPLVVAEAISYGRPVIAYGLACLPSLIGPSGGVVVPCDADFAAEAADRVEEWVNNRERFFDIVQLVQSYSETLRSEADLSMKRLVKLLRVADDGQSSSL